MTDEVVQFQWDELDAATAAAISVQTLIEGGRPGTWWRTDGRALADRFVRELQTSLTNGETLQQTTTRMVGGTVDGIPVKGIMGPARRNAAKLVATSVNAISNRARFESFQANADIIKGIQQVSTFDNKTTDTCIAYSGEAWRIEDLRPFAGSSLPFNGGPPRHFSCRSTLVPIIRSFRELGFGRTELPVGTRASLDGQIPADLSFDQWLRGKSVTFQNQLLGVGKARLWRDGKLSLKDLVDFRGNPLTLAQLEQSVV